MSEYDISSCGTPVLGCFGHGGDSITFDSRRVRMSGCGTPADPACTANLRRYPGTPLLDKTTVPDIDKLISLACSGPMVGGYLPAGHQHVWGEAPEPYNGSAKDYDYVAVDVYMALWKEAGARVGVVGSDGTFEWQV